ncbi:MAG: FtsX-like permease family protein [Roseivirga sp.]|nr:FtsX-like permease family protein [Roseivirga sp.]
MKKQVNIPKLVHAFFKWYCKSDRYEELHGDLEEFFYERAEEMGLVKARFYYLRDVIRCCQPYAWKKPKVYSNSNIIMFKNYFKTSLRSMTRNPLGSFINVFGLSVAIGICLVVYSFVAYDYSLDQFHENKNEVYLTTIRADRNGAEVQYGLSPTPLGELLKDDFAQISKVARVKDVSVVMKYEDKVFYENLRFTDPEFLEMLTFPLKWGSPDALIDVNSIILSEPMSVKYFGDENPIGEDILVKFGEEGRKIFRVAGVAEAFPDAHIIEFGFLANFKNMKVADPAFDEANWADLLDATLIQVPDPMDIEAIRAGMVKYKALQNDIENDWKINSFDFEPLASLHLNAGGIEDAISYDYTEPGRVILPIIALLMIFMACFNYINVAIVSSARRLKEIGVRKVIGANRGKVIVQFLAENILLTFFAMLVGILLAYTLFLPWLANQAALPLRLSPTDLNLWLFLIFILLLTGLASGIYPALYISKFDVARIFRGSIRFGKKSPLTKVFLGFQLVVACITITGAIAFTQNTLHINSRSWGYDQTGALYTSITDKSAFDQLYSAMSQNPNVLSVSGSRDHLGMVKSQAVLRLPDRQYEVDQLSIDAQYFETMGLQLTTGRNFKPDPESDRQSIIVNKALVENMAWAEPLTEVVTIDSARYQVVGVTEDFQFNSFYSPVKPTLFKVADKDDYRFLSVRARAGAERETYDALKAEWVQLFPEVPFQGGYQEDVWPGFFEDVAIQERFMKVVAFIAILLSSLGLYGLVTLNVAGRVREFSIRKALGAGVKNIAFSILRQYMLLSVIALLIAAPLSYIAINANINMLYAEPMPLTYTVVTLAVVLLIFILLTVISTQIRKVSKSSPVVGLRTE